MNYYEARRVKDVEPAEWHFTGMNDGRIWPVGCSKDCHHATPEEACQHWVEYQIGIGCRRVECVWTSCRNREGFDDQGRPRFCPKPARTHIQVGDGPNGGSYTLCDDHAADNIAEALFRLDHEGLVRITSSW